MQKVRKQSGKFALRRKKFIGFTRRRKKSQPRDEIFFPRDIRYNLFIFNYCCQFYYTREICDICQDYLRNNVEAEDRK